MIVGVDPGTNGAVSFIDDDGKLKALARIKNGDYSEVRSNIILYEDKIERIYVEKVNSCASKQSSFAFGKQVGILIGMFIMVYLEDKIIFVAPVKWQEKLKCRCGGDKKQHQKKAVEIFPEWEKEIMKCQDLSDAPCIGYYGYLDYYKT